MFENFCKFFHVNNIDKNKQIAFENKNRYTQMATGYNELMSNCQGSTFGNGLYRLHNLNEIKKWNEIIEEAYPEFKGNIECFGYDWLGRQFSLDIKNIKNGEPQIIIYEIGTADILYVPCTFLEFHESEIPNHYNACLEAGFFSEWFKNTHIHLQHNQCAGYKTPLFLNGEDAIDNLEVSDMEVYWSIIGQIRIQI